MGITPFFAEKLLEAKKRGVSFKKTATLGRLNWFVGPKEEAELARRFDVSRKIGRDLCYGGFSEFFLQDWLGAEDLTEIDASRFEGARLIHDLNEPIPGHLCDQFDAVIDTGTLEHVFNFPTAIKSALSMIKKEGFFFWVAVANNYCGHGFYQFSPELVFRILSPENGFAIEDIVLMTQPFPGGELSPKKSLYALKDPAEIKTRVAFVGSRPAVVIAQARRVALTPVLQSFPQQSDYARAWNGEGYVAKIFGSDKGNRLGLAAIWLSNHLPLRMRNWGAGMYNKYFLCTLRNRALFRKL